MLRILIVMQLALVFSQTLRKVSCTVVCSFASQIADHSKDMVEMIHYVKAMFEK